MKKRIAILGSTGSIGKSLLKIIAKNKKLFEIQLLTANSNYKELINQTRKFNVKNVIIKDSLSYKKFVKLNKNKNIKIYRNFDKLNTIFKKKIDYLMSSIVGIDGLYPTIYSIKYTKKIAIANKEVLICAWNIIKKELKKNKTLFVPVDSEHFSIWYGLRKTNFNNINKIYLTASGGPFLKLPSAKFKYLKISQVLKHPNWKMGKKITTDSATMMNKVFEIIEARKIFNVSFKKLFILIHPKSYIHAIIKFNDGMIKIVAHNTTMEIPIFNTLYGEEKKFYNMQDLDLYKLNNLNLTKVNINQFPTIKILKNIPEKESLYETAIVSANDELVKLFLKKKIKFNQISSKLLKFLNKKEIIKLQNITPNKISDIIKINNYVRLKILTESV